MSKPLKTRAQTVMDAFESRPKNFGPMRDASAHAKITGPCGDTVEVWFRIDGGRIRRGTFMSDGCGYSCHCCSTAVKLAEGMVPDAAAEITREQVLAAAGEIPPDHRHCALLAANTIRKALMERPDSKPNSSLISKIRRKFTR
ncbi:MAG: iron-sulfur cluster assembly scaffold protein [Pontiellaceae bacterium]|nr:iron-sulfur cluster assembly scaffold protein [Pontiellaceae bacterium]MBN2783319.1 iron-sulfur cluster assembly scaffold protein [Pontiellaceae bacterium]